jgi:hypothetical protein
MTNEEKIFSSIISCEIGSYMTTYGPDRAVITISNLCALNKLTRYAARKALKNLREEGVIEYVSQGCPAVVSYGEVPELVYEAGPPINGYALTKKGFETETWKQAYAEWNRSLEEWANG